jgi:hypothetical protein
MDSLANLEYGTTYAELNDEQKRTVAGEDSVKTKGGALDLELRQARAAGAAGSRVAL